MTKHLVLVAGNLGSGKTSLVELVGKRLDWFVGYESVSDNPYLTDFYKDMRTWSFHLQIHFLGHRAEQHLAASILPQSAILDRSIYEDAYVFARALYDVGNIAKRDYESYLKIFNIVTKTLPLPSLLLYLKAPLNVLVERIRSRGQGFDQGLSEDYLALIETFYESWLSAFNLCPILTINTDNLDYISNPNNSDIIIKHMLEKLN